MNVLLAGASGAIGVPLTRHLIAAGHRVVGLSRTPINHNTLRTLGAKTVVVDAIDRDALLRTVDGLQADAVIHQLTALKNASPRVRTDDPTSALRVRGTSNLLDAASLVGVRRFLTQSLIFGYGYGDHGTRELTEQDPFGHPQGGYADSVIAALESAERQTFAADGIESIALRYGIFYGPNTFSDLFVDLMRRRRFAIPRGGGGTMSWVHVEDAATATIAALERGGPGRAYNVVDDEPVAMKAFAGLIALALVRRWGRIFPGWMLLILAWGAGTLLAWHGALFVGTGSLMLGGFISGPATPGLWAVVRWYTFLWGPWFVFGGVLFMAAGWSFLRGLPAWRTGWASSMLGVLGGLGVSVAMLLFGIG